MLRAGPLHYIMLDVGQARVLTNSKFVNMTYLITYDLRRPGKNYDALYEHLKSYSNHRHPMDSVWFVKTTNSAATIRDMAKKHMDSNDMLFVCKVGNWGSYNLPNTSEWLNA